MIEAVLLRISASASSSGNGGGGSLGFDTLTL
jgi:hypothetical protein